MDRPLLLLDVDGTLSPHVGDDACPPPPYVSIDRYAAVHRDLPEWLAELRRWYEPVWATTWEDEANASLAAPLGLPALPVVPMRRPPHAPDDTWRLGPVEAWVGDRPAAWVDDEIGPRGIRWAQTRPVPTIAVVPDPAVGVTRRDVDRLLRFARRLARR